MKNIYIILAMLCINITNIFPERSDVRENSIEHDFTKKDNKCAELSGVSEYKSNVIDVNITPFETFIRVNASWESNKEVEFCVRASSDAAQWSDWYIIEPFDNPMMNGQCFIFNGDLGVFFDYRIKYIQYKIISKEHASIFNVKLYYSSVSPTSKDSQAKINEIHQKNVKNFESQQLSSINSSLQVVSRQTWGGNDIDSKTRTPWDTISYFPVRHIAIHHTATIVAGVVVIL